MKKRLDMLMMERALAPSREKAKAYIMAGDVYVDGQKEDKAGTMFPETVKIEVRGNTLPYVSRGGLKLEKAMKNFDVTLDGKVCMDVGASTGGFTDCMLQNGAVKVYSIDVGYGQHWHTIEGAFYFYKDGIHYLMYSGACYQNPTYFIGYCTAKGPEDADLRTLEWKKYPDENTYAPLLTKNEIAEGLGHNSVLYEDGKYYIVYHARDYGDIEKKEDTRSARIDELIVDDGKLSVKRL